MAPPLLRRSALPAGADLHPGTAALPERILQFGEGNFLRGFTDWLVERANRRGLAAGRVVVVQPRGHGPGGATLNAQDCLYHVAERGIEAGAPVDRTLLVGALSRCLDPRSQWDQVLSVARSRELAVLVSNTTEAGIAYAAEPAPAAGAAPASFPAKLAAVLHERWRAAAGDPAWGLLVLPCELIEANGRRLREAVLRHAADWGLPAAFAAWVEGANAFCDTLVDRIVPGFPAAEAEAWERRLGCSDRALVVAEPYLLWAIAGDPALAARLPLHEVGNVVWTDDLAPLRTRKVRILNGGHTALSAVGFLAGLDTVGAAVADPACAAYLARLLDEILPGLAGDPAGLRAYAATVRERFANPHVRHELLSIALNALAKWKVRLLPSLEAAAAAGRPAPALAFSLAALLAFCRGVPGAAPGELAGERDGRAYPIRDDAAALAIVGGRWAACGAAGDLRALADDLLGDARLWGRDLRPLGLVAPVAAGLAAIRTGGMRAALADLPKGNA